MPSLSPSVSESSPDIMSIIDAKHAAGKLKERYLNAVNCSQSLPLDSPKQNLNPQLVNRENLFILLFSIPFSSLS